MVKIFLEIVIAKRFYRGSFTSIKEKEKLENNKM